MLDHQIIFNQEILKEIVLKYAEDENLYNGKLLNDWQIDQLNRRTFECLSTPISDPSVLLTVYRDRALSRYHFSIAAFLNTPYHFFPMQKRTGLEYNIFNNHTDERFCFTYQFGRTSIDKAYYDLQNKLYKIVSGRIHETISKFIENYKSENGNFYEDLNAEQILELIAWRRLNPSINQSCFMVITPSPIREYIQLRYPSIRGDDLIKFVNIGWSDNDGKTLIFSLDDIAFNIEFVNPSVSIEQIPRYRNLIVTAEKVNAEVSIRKGISYKSMKDLENRNIQTTRFRSLGK